MRNCFSCGTLTAENAEKKTGIGAVIGAPRGQAIHDNNVTGNYYINGDKPFGNNNGNGRGDLINNKKISISVSSSNDNHGTVSTSYVNPTTNTNTLLQVTATPAAHYHFGSWSDEGEQTHTVGLTDNVNLTATFAPNPYTITVTSADENMGTVSGGGTYDYNSRQTITATPKTGYYFKKWNDGYASASRQVTITGDQTYTATFAIYQYSITANANNAEYGTVTGSGRYNYNTEVTLTATPKEGYQFDKWNDGDTNASRKITVTNSATYTATFAQRTFKAVFVDGTLTFYYDILPHSEGTSYDLPGERSAPDWLDKQSSTEKVVFDASFSEYRPTSCFRWFDGFSNLSTITGISNLNTSKVTNMSCMFVACSKLAALDLSSFNTEKVTDMSYMFTNCSGLTTLDPTGFNTSNVTNMGSMFKGCSSLTTLDLTGFNTENVTDMSYMFFRCWGLTTLNVSSFNTSNVTNMGYMFSECNNENFTTLDLSSFNTSNVTKMASMFSYCPKLQSLTIGNFDMQKVTNNDYMIYEAWNLKTLTLKAVPYLQGWTFNRQFSGDGVTVNYQLDDNSVIYTGTNYLPAATKAPTYTRTIAADSQWGTAVMPFEAKSDANVQLYALAAVGDGKVTLSPVATVAANTPCIFKKKVADATSVVFTANSNATPVAATPVTPEAVGGLTLTGTYSAAKVATEAGYVLNADQFKKTSAETAVSPFQAYLSGAIADVNTLTIQIGVPGDINGDSVITIADLIRLVEILNGRATDTNGTADVDGQNGVTVDDVDALSNKLLGR